MPDFLDISIFFYAAHRHPLNIVTDGRPPHLLHDVSVLTHFFWLIVFFSLSLMIRQRLPHTLTPTFEQSDLSLLFYNSQLQIWVMQTGVGLRVHTYACLLLWRDRNTLGQKIW